MNASSRFEYEIYVPLSDNHGNRFPADVLSNFRKAIVDEFGGLTDLNFKSQGVWRIGGIEYHDEVVIWKVIATEQSSGETFFLNLKSNMKERLQQKDILIVKKEIKLL